MPVGGGPCRRAWADRLVGPACHGPHGPSSFRPSQGHRYDPRLLGPHSRQPLGVALAGESQIQKGGLYFLGSTSAMMVSEMLFKTLKTGIYLFESNLDFFEILLYFR